MAVPKYHEMMLPLLQQIADGKPHAMGELAETLAAEFKLTSDDRKLLLPTGGQYRFENRLGWARTYLKKAGLLESPDRGYVLITQRGLDYLNKKPQSIRPKDLMIFEEYRQFTKPTTEVNDVDSTGSELDETPQELIERNLGALRANLASELLEKIKKLSPQFFERLVVDLLVSMGYGGSRKDAGSAIGGSGDGGIDGIIKQDSLGLDVVYIQAKRWENTVGSPEVRTFVGSLAGVKAQRGVMLTTSSFSKEAEKYVEKIGERVILIDGNTLTNLMIEHGVGVSTVQTLAIKKIDNDFFTED
jgi:restriction system protein